MIISKFTFIALTFPLSYSVIHLTANLISPLEGCKMLCTQHAQNNTNTSPSPQALFFSSTIRIRKWHHHCLSFHANHKRRCQLGNLLFPHSYIQSILISSHKYLSKSTYWFWFPLPPLYRLQFAFLYCSQNRNLVTSFQAPRSLLLFG